MKNNYAQFHTNQDKFFLHPCYIPANQGARKDDYEMPIGSYGIDATGFWFVDFHGYVHYDLDDRIEFHADLQACLDKIADAGE